MKRSLGFVLLVVVTAGCAGAGDQAPAAMTPMAGHGGSTRPTSTSGGTGAAGAGANPAAGAGGVGGGAGAGAGSSAGGAAYAPGDLAVAPVDLVAADAPGSNGLDAPASDRLASDDDDRKDGFSGVTPDGPPWQRLCPDGTSRADCCSLYCGCMVKFCPRTLPASCQSACQAAKTWDLTCRTYQCFASQNPNFPQDHDSHCQHAIGKQGRCGDRPGAAGGRPGGHRERGRAEGS